MFLSFVCKCPPRKTIKRVGTELQKGFNRKIQSNLVCDDEHSDHPGTVCHPATGGGTLPLPRLANTVRNPPLRPAKGNNLLSSSHFKPWVVCIMQRLRTFVIPGLDPGT